MADRRKLLWVVLVLLLALLLAAPFEGAPPDFFDFAILGDRTGEVRPGVYEQVWKEMAGGGPSFVVSVGDTIQGLDDATAEAEWRAAAKIFKPFERVPLYLTAGNHDVWSPLSERLFVEHAGHPLHYGFDYRQVHVTVLDNSRSDELADSELDFLESDLRAHARQAVKLIVSHRPSWLVNVAVGNGKFRLQQLAKQFGVQYVVAGHVHQMIHLELDGVTYVSMPSAGGHLRLSEEYKDGWFFGYASVHVQDKTAEFTIRETGAPAGKGRVTKLADWGMTGLTAK